MVLDEDAAAGLGVLGVVIDRVVPGSEAERVGLQGIDYRNRILGDIIVRAGNQEIKNIDDFIRILENYAIGQSIILDVRRDDQVRTVEVKIMDISVKLAKTSGNRMYISKLRVTLKELTESLWGVNPSDCTKNNRVLRLGLRLPAGEEKGLCHETQTVHSGFQKICSRATAQ